MIEFLYVIGPVAFPTLLMALWFLGWMKQRKWAKIIFVITLVTLIVTGVLFGLYVHGMGQANWSL